MQIELRDPKKIMKLKRLGSFHQSKLSFLRSFLREFNSWDYKRELFELDNDGYGVAVYTFKKEKTPEEKKNFYSSCLLGKQKEKRKTAS